MQQYFFKQKIWHKSILVKIIEKTEFFCKKIILFTLRDVYYLQDNNINKTGHFINEKNL